MPSSFKVGDRVRGRHTKRIGTISSSASPGFGGEARWNVYFDNDRTESCSERVLMPVEQDAVGVLDSLISAARAARYVGAISPADADSVITIAGVVHGPSETGIDALVTVARSCVDSGVLPQASVDRILGIVHDDALNVRVGDYVRERDTGWVYRVAARDYGVYKLQGTDITHERPLPAATLRAYFEVVNVTPVKGHTDNA